MSGILLSVCIPVYNFGAFIGATLAEKIYGDVPVRTRLRFLVFRYLPPNLLLLITRIRSSLRSVLVR